VNIVSIAEARRFSLDTVQSRELVAEGDLSVTLLCFEAGQRDEDHSFSSSCLYQVLEGEVLLRHEGGSDRVGTGKLVSVPAGTQHHLENAGGGLLVVLATHAR
jgi:quercetin dioxygenase-like cupin family protein